MTPDFWRDKRVFVSGHTGFKGGWLCLWLQSMGAEVHGYALQAPTEPNFFKVAGVENGMASSTIADVRDYEKLLAAIKDARPEIVMHLAAQPLVRYSYQNPVETFSVNVMGVVHLLEAVRTIGGVRAVVNVTTDKCYENREWPWGYRENEAMGGHDPYSSSKGCAELVTAAYRRSFFAESGIAVATARAGNVIGGGDWAADRLLPDFLRAIDAGAALTIRSPGAIRPWQHVLEPLSGYLTLAEQLDQHGSAFAEPWNFGPADEDAQTVGWIVDHLASRNPGMAWCCDMSSQLHEANYLKLDSSKARTRLLWKPRWRLQVALDITLAWHQAWRSGQDMRGISLAQISEYLSEGKAASVKADNGSL
ncbi:MAG: CDP-glucose 4,6-dehydratase [Azonexus sp.]|nr:CDP-glucose 4,6-dehydratase [Azonexus sp.]